MSLHYTPFNGLYGPSRFFKKPNPADKLAILKEFKKLGCGILAGLSVGGFALLIFTIIHVTLTPWLLLAAAPYFLVGAALGYSVGDAILEKKASDKSRPATAKL